MLHRSLPHNRCFPRIGELLRYLREGHARVSLALVTRKPVYFFVNIVIIAIVKIYLRFRDWDRVELCRVLRTRVLSSCVECVARVRAGPRARADADADDATAAPSSRA